MPWPHPFVAALTIGLEDYTADLGVVKTAEGSESLWARSRLVNAARAAGVQAIDSVYSDVADEEGLLAWGQRSRGMGFQGMGCIHPRQIRVIHQAFAPAPAELDKGAPDRGGLRGGRKAGTGRGEPRHEDDRSARGSPGQEAGGGGHGKPASSMRPKPRQKLKG